MIAVKISVIRLFCSPKITCMKESAIETTAHQHKSEIELLKKAKIPIIDDMVDITPEIVENISKLLKIKKCENFVLYYSYFKSSITFAK